MHERRAHTCRSRFPGREEMFPGRRPLSTCRHLARQDAGHREISRGRRWAKPSGCAPHDGEMGSHPQRCSGSLGDFNQLWHSQLLCVLCKATG